MQTIFVCLITRSISKRIWFRYILFLVFVGGILILFIYIASLSPNEKISLSIKLIKKLIIWITLCIIITIVDKNFLMFIDTIDRKNFDNIIILIKENQIDITKIYEIPNNFITIILIIYLLLTLVIVVKVTNSFIGPLRRKNYE